jgi:hypothetical protein
VCTASVPRERRAVEPASVGVIVRQRLSQGFYRSIVSRQIDNDRGEKGGVGAGKWSTANIKLFGLDLEVQSRFLTAAVVGTVVPADIPYWACRSSTKKAIDLSFPCEDARMLDYLDEVTVLACPLPSITTWQTS